MKRIKRYFVHAWMLFLPVFVFSANASKSDKERSSIDNRINAVRKKIRDRVIAGDTEVLKSLNIPVDISSDWVNWNNWGNWANWNNWNNWANWANWGNWRNF